MNLGTGIGIKKNLQLEFLCGGPVGARGVPVGGVGVLPPRNTL